MEVAGKGLAQGAPLSCRGPQTTIWYALSRSRGRPPVAYRKDQTHSFSIVSLAYHKIFFLKMSDSDGKKVVKLVDDLSASPYDKVAHWVGYLLLLLSMP